MHVVSKFRITITKCLWICIILYENHYFKIKTNTFRINITSRYVYDIQASSQFVKLLVSKELQINLSNKLQTNLSNYCIGLKHTKLQINLSNYSLKLKTVVSVRPAVIQRTGQHPLPARKSCLITNQDNEGDFRSSYKD